MANELTYVPLDDDSNYFYSYDLGLCAYLNCIGFRLHSLDKSSGTKVLFIIKRDDRDMEEYVQAFWNSENAAVDAQTYFNALKRLKNQIHSS